MSYEEIVHVTRKNLLPRLRRVWVARDVRLQRSSARDSLMQYTDPEIEELIKYLREIDRKPYSQSKRHSWYETFTGTFTGFLGSLLITFIVFSYVPGSLAVKAWVNTLACTVWSIVRGYYNRRFWNWMHTK